MMSNTTHEEYNYHHDIRAPASISAETVHGPALVNNTSPLNDATPPSPTTRPACTDSHTFFFLICAEESGSNPSWFSIKTRSPTFAPSGGETSSTFALSRLYIVYPHKIKGMQAENAHKD
mmetsp:Transcript_6233/g.13478  ORF Transcript_6233/g.13478 Transcript_6233/m.13478 type:complete len:120 (+) Transcript_6233:148-507(+)